MWLSLLGLYNYDNTVTAPLESQLLQFMTLTEVNNLRDRLLLETAELEVVYPSVETMKIALRAWAQSRKTQWKKQFEALAIQYEPAENYDRHEEWTDNATSGNTHKVQGFNSTTSVTANEDSGVAGNIHSGRVHGNIGVTTNQQMLTSELEFRSYDFYESVISEFKKMFTVGVY